MSAEDLIWGRGGSDFEKLNKDLEGTNIVVAWAYAAERAAPERLIVGFTKDVKKDISPTVPSNYHSLLSVWLNVMKWTRLVEKGQHIPLVTYLANPDSFILESVMEALHSLIE